MLGRGQEQVNVEWGIAIGVKLRRSPCPSEKMGHVVQLNDDVADWDYLRLRSSTDRSRVGGNQDKSIDKDDRLRMR
jgi:hypothetical protein